MANFLGDPQKVVAAGQQSHRRATGETSDLRPNNKSSDLTAEIDQEAKRLINNPSAASRGIRQENVMNRFIAFTKAAGRNPVVNKQNVILFISHLSLAQYTNTSIRLILKTLFKCEGVQIEPPNLESDCEVQTAINHAGKRAKDEDTRIPATIQLLHELGSIFDRDLGSYEAITMKAMIWTATFCMLRCSEYCKNDTTSEHNDHALLRNNITILPDGISVTFESWKGHIGSQTLFFPNMPEFKPVRKWLKQYLLIRPTHNETPQLFTTAPGKPFDQRLFNQYFHHAVDHSRWVGLNLATHSLRIGGVTIRHTAKVDTAEIKRLGCWKTEVMFRYVRDSWLEQPEQL